MNNKKLIVQHERLWRDIVARQNQGVVEIKTPVGTIDVLCEKDIYEVKHVRKWKHALGQVLAYGYFYPLKSKNIYLFGESSTETREQIIAICQQYKVSAKFTDFKMAEHSLDLALQKAEIIEREKVRLSEKTEIEKLLFSLKKNKNVGKNVR